MPFAVSRKTWLLLAPAALLLGVVGYRAVLLAAAPALPPVAASAAAAPVAMDVPDQDQRRRSSVQVLPAASPDRRAALERSPDLYRTAQQLSAAAAQGDADASWLLSRIYDYCAGYAMDPAGYAADTRAIDAAQLPMSARMAVARARVGRRCAGFVPGDGLTRQAIVAQRVRAARGGNLAAEAALLALGQPLQSSAGYKRHLVERVRASGDPDAYLALAPAMGLAANGDDSLDERIAGTAFTELAWQLAACRLGLDCGPNSELMTRYCANGGICSQDPAQDFSSFVYAAAVPRQGTDTMNEMVNRLMDTTATGAGS
ncbi:hypothetical protein [Xanthomonas translucens]|uniref:hypothetical protein n=4 Tax=Xanthomonas campestris pv. translucens TaxID=343 RepID=UPI0006420F2B|nr:hypothetical protein [Xanthomonas translucens]AKK69174.1 hypothetical protein FD63_17675 [Xanthomonas translucens pv. undulosa]MBC3972602.1 hypothetical protein [Xanthomonas translucens pv. undulosa]MCT8272703.1 hypothetical protein [Xanthomonas translucens pv. undulosa]MCT8281675.1 hypothetical protein [Xanthomonas translucens pv. undulosa]MCT8316366.1 hypothetical protein [Xanthomonas translucens pv. undulosa]